MSSTVRDAAPAEETVDPGIAGLAWLFGLGALALVFGLLAVKVRDGDTAGFDRAILLWFRDPADLARLRGPVWLLEMCRDLTSLGSTAVLGLLLLAVAGYLAFGRKWVDLALVLVSVLGGQAASTVLKLLFERARPDLIPGAPRVFTTSFPSAHAMMSAVTFLTLGALLSRIESRRALKLYAIGAALVVTVIVGTSRVALGVHWPTDVLGGWCVGAGWAMLCSVTAARLKRRGKLERLP